MGQTKNRRGQDVLAVVKRPEKNALDARISPRFLAREAVCEPLREGCVGTGRLVFFSPISLYVCLLVRLCCGNLVLGYNRGSRCVSQSAVPSVFAEFSLFAYFRRRTLDCKKMYSVFSTIVGWEQE